MEPNYHVTELECLTVVYSIRGFRPYIYGKHFTVMVDHCSLCYLIKTNNPTRRLSRWALLLQEYDFHKFHKTIILVQRDNGDCLQPNSTKIFAAQLQSEVVSLRPKRANSVTVK